MGVAPALGTRAAALHVREKARGLWEIKIQPGTISTARKIVTPGGHKFASDIQVITSLIGSRDACANGVRQAHFGGFEGRLPVGKEASGHGAQTVSDKFAGQLGGVEIFCEALRADVCSGCPSGKNVVRAWMPRVTFSGIE